MSSFLTEIDRWQGHGLAGEGNEWGLGDDDDDHHHHHHHQCCNRKINNSLVGYLEQILHNFLTQTLNLQSISLRLFFHFLFELGFMLWAFCTYVSSGDLSTSVLNKRIYISSSSCLFSHWNMEEYLVLGMLRNVFCFRNVKVPRMSRYSIMSHNHKSGGVPGMWRNAWFQEWGEMPGSRNVEDCLVPGMWRNAWFQECGEMPGSRNVEKCLVPGM